MIENLCEYVWKIIPATISKRFIGDLPSLSAEGVAMYQDEGLDPIRYLGMKSVIHQPYIKFVIRAKVYSHGDDWGETVRGNLEGFHDDSIMSIHQVGSLMHLGKTEMDLHEFQMQFIVNVKE